MSGPLKSDVVLTGRRERFKSGGEFAEAQVFEPVSPRGSLLVLHEVWGYNPFVRDVCLRITRAGFSAFAPILYWRESELFSPARIREAMKVVWDLPLEDRYESRKIEAVMGERNASEKTRLLLRTLYDREFRARISADLVALANLASSEGRGVGAIGFSMGGGFAFRLASEFTRLRACVAFSAEPPGESTLRRIGSPILAIYGSQDEFMTRDVPAFVDYSKKHKKELTLQTYPNAGHEFFDRRNRKGYRREAAEKAWRSAMAFLEEKLS